MASWKWLQFIAQRAEGYAASPASLFASLIRFSAPPPLLVNPHQQVDGVPHIGDEDPIGKLRGFEQLVLLGLAGLRFLLLLVAQRQEAIGPAPSLRLIAKFALPVGIGAGRRLPGRRLQLLHQTRRLAR